MSKMRVAVVGAGISGLVAAHVLAKEGVDVVIYEKEDYLGGHAKTVTMDGIDLDLGFMVFNRVRQSNFMFLLSVHFVDSYELWVHLFPINSLGIILNAPFSSHLSFQLFKNFTRRKKYQKHCLQFQ